MKNWIDPAMAFQAILWGALIVGFFVVKASDELLKGALCGG